MRFAESEPDSEIKPIGGVRLSLMEIGLVCTDCQVLI